MLIYEKCPYIGKCDKYLTVCKLNHDSDCVHLSRLKIVDSIYDEVFKPMLKEIEVKKINIAVQKKNRRDLIGVDGYVLLPIGDEEDKKLNSYSPNQILNVDIKGSIDPRSLAQLRLYWVCAGKVAENTTYPTDKDVDEYVKLRCHYVDKFYDVNGKINYRTKSISFENMEQPEFNEFMDNAIPVMAELLGCSEEQLTNSQHDI